MIEYNHSELETLSLAEIRSIRKSQNNNKGKEQINLPPLPRNANVVIPLSFSQSRLWVLEQIEEIGATYNVPFAIKLVGQLDAEALEAALTEVVRRHESLRTRIEISGGEPIQIIDSIDYFKVNHTYLEIKNKTAQEKELRNIALQENQLRFNLAKDLPIRAHLVQLGENVHGFFLTLHHIAADGWSVGILWSELSQLYQANINSDDLSLPEPELQYADYTIWQRNRLESGILENQLRYWRDQMAGAPEVLNLPYDHPRPSIASFNGKTSVFKISSDTIAGLRMVARSEGATLFMVLLAAFKLVLSRLTGQSDIVIGTPIAARTHSNLEELIGFFANTLVLRTNLSKGLTFSKLVGRVREIMLDAYAHQEVPFEQLVAELSTTRDLSRQPLFQVMMAMQKVPQFHLDKLDINPINFDHVTSKFDLNLSILDADEGFSAVLEYSTDLFDTETAENLSKYLNRVLKQVATNPDQHLDQYSLLSQSDYNEIVVKKNATEMDYEKECCVHNLFERQARETPDATAVICENEHISYQELDRRSNQLARHLIKTGVGPEVIVGLCLERSVDMVIGMLGILKAGGAYLPLDPKYPKKRLDYMLRDTQAMAMIVHSSTENCVSIDNLKIVNLESVLGDQRDFLCTAPASNVHPDNLAYIIYTSGSTGKPKGVALCHSAVCLTKWAEAYYQDGVFKTVIASTSICFDLSVFEIFVPLSLGGTLLLVKNGISLPEAADQATLLNTVPSVIAELLDTNRFPSGVSTLNVAGEPLRSKLVQEIFLKTSVKQVYNLYGPSEYTTYSTAALIDRCSVAEPTIGRPIANTQVFILDSELNPLPPGSSGELYMAGDGLARAYINRCALTSERFVPNPFGKPGSRMYRTGDVARWNRKGEIDFLGRIDHQIKLRGYRIELGEIENALLSHTDVAEAVVVTNEIDGSSPQQLIAYFVTSPSATVDTNMLHSWLRITLPIYMLPSLIINIDEIPLTVNGKIDRKLLSKLSSSQAEISQENSVYSPPQTMTEIALSEIWQDLLGLSSVGRFDNFFGMGGHSLLAVRMISIVRDRLNVEIPLRDLFSNPLLSDFAKIMDKGGEEILAPIKKQSRDNPIPLSFAQQRLWFLCQMEGAGIAYHLPISLKLSGQLDHIALETALNVLVSRHESLRTRFVNIKGTIFQTFEKEEMGFTLTTHSLCTTSDLDSELSKLLEQEASKDFDLECGPLVRGSLVRLSTDVHVLQITLHHIIADGWSIGILKQNLGNLYNHFCHKQGSLDPLHIQYADYAVWQRERLTEEILDRQTRFWQKTMRGAPPLLNIPTDHSRPAVQDFRGEYLELTINKDLTAILNNLAERSGVTMFMVLLAACGITLSRLAGQKEIVIGTVNANRQRPELEPLIGLFGNTLALRLDLSGQPNIEQLLQRIKTTVLEAQAHQELPFEQIVETFQAHRNLSYSPIFQFMFGWQNYEQKLANLDGLKVEALSTNMAVAKFDMALGLHERDSCIVGGVEFATSLFDRSTVERYIGYLKHVLYEMALRPNQTIDVIPLEANTKYDSPTTKPYQYGHARCLHELFELSVEINPDAIAIVCEEETLTYQELNKRANKLAHHLRSIGIRSDKKVGICVERSMEMVIGSLATIKAGGCYVPLDPIYPPERLNFIIDDVGLVAILCHEATRQVLDVTCSNLPTVPLLIDLNIDADDWEGQPSYNSDCHQINLTAANIAYIIYTSGSTGKPKGVMVTHRNVTRLFSITDKLFKFGPDDVWSIFHSFAFDFSVWEMWGALLSGGRVVIVPQLTAQNSEEFLQLVCKEGITILNQTPSAFSMLSAVQFRYNREHCLRVIIFGGEALDITILKSWQANKLNQRTKLVNMFGITETTVHTTYTEISGDNRSKAGVIGTCLGDMRAYVLDSNLGMVALGVVGELYIAGEGVARGYVNNPALTAERFLPDPFGLPSERMYRSGDLVRRLKNGELEYIGRSDHQIKIRGYRIELGEIEASIKEQPYINDAVVTVHEDSSGEKRLVAYIISNTPSDESLCVLSNGLQIHCANRHETRTIYEEIFENKSYLQHGISIDDNSCILDVGANVGLFSLYVKGITPTSKLYAFEPADQTFNTLKLNLERYGLDVRAMKIALSDYDGDATFYHYPKMSVNSGLYANQATDLSLTERFVENKFSEGSSKLINFLQDRFQIEAQTCEVQRLSTFIRSENLEKIDLLKIDVEKSELDILNGIEQEHWPLIHQIVVEVHDIDRRLSTITELLIEKGFEVVSSQDSELTGTNLFKIFAHRRLASSNYAKKSTSEWSITSFPINCESPIDVSIRNSLKDSLPEYMIPASFVRLDKVPLTMNGKLDYEALPAPAESYTSPTYKEPTGLLEQTIASIWQEILNIAKVGQRDNFFDIGGHSLTAIKMITNLSAQLGIEVPLHTLFSKPILQEFSKAIETLPQAHIIENTLLSSQHNRLPLTSSQQRIWFLEEMNLTSPTYNIPTLIEVQGDLKYDVLKHSLKQLICRHSALRMRFGEEDGIPFQSPDKGTSINLSIEDISKLARSDHDKVINDWKYSSSRYKFNLREDQLIRFHLLKVTDHNFLLMIVVHHIICDGWSIAIILDEIASHYQSYDNISLSTIADKPVQFYDHIHFEKTSLEGPNLDSLLSHWRNKLEGAPPFIAINTDRSRPEEPSFEGDLVPFKLDRELSYRLRVLAREENVTLYMLFLTLFSTILYRWSGQDDLVVGTMVANRKRRETQGTIGLFANSLPLRLNFAGNPDFSSALRRVREVCLDAFSHQDLPFEKLVDELKTARDFSRQPIFQIMFLMQEELGISQRQAGEICFTPIPAGRSTTSKVDLTLAISDDDTVITGLFEFASDLFDKDTIERLAGQIETAARAALVATSTQISELPTIGSAEMRKLLVDFNATNIDFCNSGLLHSEFERYAVEMPDAIALIDADFGRKVTFSEANQWANQIANGLIQESVKSESVIAMCLPRSVEQVICFIAILKAGCVYLPIDLANPDARISYMLEDSGANVAFVNDTNWSRIQGLKSPIAIQRALFKEEDVALFPQNLPTRRVHPQNIAYVLYTSGSTGLPKGVMGEHGPMLNRLLSQPNVAPIERGEIALQRSSIGFGASIMEILGPLSSGATLVVVPDSDSKNIEALAQYISEHRVTRTYIQPSVARAMVLVENAKQQLASLKTCTCSGEILDTTVVGDIKSLCGTKVVNIWGATELSMEAISCIADETSEIVPIGKPMPNVTAYVLDQNFNVMPIGSTGELYIGGEGLSRGYCGMPGQTAISFLPNPFEPGNRLYRTGDLARWDKKGKLEYLGRRDHQIKLRGFRIELGEIEVALLAAGGVKHAGVILHKKTDDHSILAGYAAAHPGVDLDPQKLLEHLKEWLPEYMLPSSINILKTMPLTVSGKVDRNALPEPEIMSKEKDSLLNDEEAKIASIWKKILGVENVGINENFFDLGGNSLLILRMQKLLKEQLNVSFRIAELFKHTTVAAQANHISGEKIGAKQTILDPINRANTTTKETNKQRLALQRKRRQK